MYVSGVWHLPFVRQPFFVVWMAAAAPSPLQHSLAYASCLSRVAAEVMGEVEAGVEEEAGPGASGREHLISSLYSQTNKQINN